MEQNTVQWLGPPCCLRGPFAFYKSVSCSGKDGAPMRSWKLGEFYYVHCGPQEPVCIAEVTLLWEDHRQRHMLASSRLYFRPEDMPKGRTGEHGEDEVLVVSKKIVIRVEDLVNWTCSEPPHWRPSSPKSNGLLKEVKTEGKDALPVQQSRVKVLSYPQYCRFRALQKRVQYQSNCHDLHNPHLMALGGAQMTLHNTRVLYCRDTFNHPTLGSNPSFMSQFGCTSLSLKGRPQKRKRREGSESNLQNLSQSESWGNRMKEDLKGEVEMRWEGSWLPHPEEQLFLDKLFQFMERRGSPISKVPNLGFKKIDLFLMFSVVKKLGGYEAVTSQRLWKTVYNELGGSPGSTSAATCTRRHYEKLILPYELHMKGGNQEQQSKPKAMAGVPSTIRKPVGRGRGGQNVSRKNEASSHGVPPDGAVVRKRGRPPGKRNAKVLPRGKVGRPPLHVKMFATAAAGKDSQTLSSLSVFQEVRLSQTQAMVARLPYQLRADENLKIELEPSPTPTSLLPAQCKLQIGGSLEGFSPTKGMCPLDVFRARLGLNGLAGSEMVPQSPLTPTQVTLLSQSKPSSPEMPPNLQHQCSGCDSENPSWPGGHKEGRTTRPPLPPLKILPLDIDCSLQLRQLMRTRLGSAHMNSFTKRLSEALAQDFSKTYQSNGHATVGSDEQAVPLNLSKKAANKRSSDGLEVWDSPPAFDESFQETKKLKMEPEDLSLTPKQNGCSSGFPLIQDEPADLSSPHRVRAFSQDRTSLNSTCVEAVHVSSKSPDIPEGITCSGISVGSQKEDESNMVPVDLKLMETPVWKSEPEKTHTQENPTPNPKGELCQDLKIKCYNVPSLKELSSSQLTKPSQSG